MGIDQTFYFGPYVECVYEPVPVVDTVYQCAQDAFHSVGQGLCSRDKFCRSCGSGVKAKHVKTDRVMSNIDWALQGRILTKDSTKLVRWAVSLESLTLITGSLIFAMMGSHGPRS